MLHACKSSLVQEKHPYLLLYVIRRLCCFYTPSSRQYWEEKWLDENGETLFPFEFDELAIKGIITIHYDRLCMIDDVPFERLISECKKLLGQV